MQGIVHPLDMGLYTRELQQRDSQRNRAAIRHMRMARRRNAIVRALGLKK